MYKILYYFFFVTIFFCGCFNDPSQSKEKVEGTVSKKNLSNIEVEKELSNLSKGLDIKYDDMKEVTYYYCPQDYNIGIKILPYVIVDKNYKAMIFDCPVCHGDEWLFFDTVYIKYNGHLYKNLYDKSKRQSQAGKRSVTELYSVPLSGDWYKILNDACNYQDVKIRFSGKFDVDKVLTGEEIENIRKIFAIYELLENVNVQ